jgi:hypothetical protein
MDSARTGVAPSPALREHLASCPNCSERWRDERVLTRELQILSDRVSSQRPPKQGLDRLMREFDRQRRVDRWRWLRWVPAPVAAVLVVAGVLAVRHQPVVTPAPHEATTAVSLDQSEEGFVAVPYAPPLAPGEFVSVERQELEPAAMVRMGLPVSEIGDAPVAADVVVGEDGFPRAVRVADETVNEF